MKKQKKASSCNCVCPDCPECPSLGYFDCPDCNCGRDLLSFGKECPDCVCNCGSSIPGF